LGALKYIALAVNGEILLEPEFLLFRDWRRRSTLIPWSQICQLEVMIMKQAAYHHRWEIIFRREDGSYVRMRLPGEVLKDPEEAVSLIVARAALEPQRFVADGLPVLFRRNEDSSEPSRV